jgi:hypothetical protein
MTFYKTMFLLPLGLQERLVLYLLSSKTHATALELAEWVASREPSTLSLDRPDDEKARHVRVVIHRLRRRLRGSGFTVSSHRGGRGFPAHYKLVEEAAHAEPVQ